jgi:Co/Zn/Cd efflux system component
MNDRLRRVVTLVALLNLAYFGIEFMVARAIGSVSLFADSVDFLEDASLNLLIAVALNWSPRNRAWLGMGLAGIILIPGVATLWTAWEKFHSPLPPEAMKLSTTAAGALVVNLTCALILTRYRKLGGSLTRAAFLSSRNDVLANVAMITSGFITALTHSGWADLIVGLGIAGLNADAAAKVWRTARAEHRSVQAA